ncbi:MULTISPECIES: 5-(carboxyamino)imidazole ribonucleotide mutase [Caloramator]|uniref:N5-carboxyaminoimidazole ribonucleotide mutase n=1 Tax=Caloramator proteoclasticus DSM 10124 TaxID=1121262 RepID=A0A1M4W0L9_9CLOT|nr:MULTISPECIES: 5-(carboxyamino)imidazole ribonucleotide mutase [Caloramator]SHE74680.1 5-(carboxyamino)imidazole ribonucleotide mutase [Caloramator proteoclasticus DSM 10124]
MASVAIIMGSISDYETMKGAEKVLKEFDVDYEIDVVSAHRTPDKMYEFAKGARDRGIKVIIAGAGGAAHLPGMVASLTTLPVIGVPVSSRLQGIDSLLSIVQMPKGVPVATVAVGGAENAALLALRMLSINDEKIAEKLSEYKQRLEMEVSAMNLKLKEVCENE